VPSPWPRRSIGECMCRSCAYVRISAVGSHTCAGMICRRTPECFQLGNVGDVAVYAVKCPVPHQITISSPASM
jgi:hypothetical protein